MSDGMTDSRRGASYTITPVAEKKGPLKTEAPNARPRKHRASVRRDRARDQWIEALRSLAVQPWVAERLCSDAFLQRARAEDYEALTALLKDLI